MTIGDVYLASLRSVMNGQVIVNTLALQTKLAPDPVTADFTVALTGVKDLLRLEQVDDLQYTDWYALKVRGAGVTYQTIPPFRVSSVAYAGAFTGTLTGASVGTPAAMQAAVMFAVNTAQAGKRRKGRFFMGGMTEAQIDDDGTLNTASRTNIQANLANGIITLLGPTGTNANFQLVVWSDRIATNTVLSATWPRVRITAGAPDPANAAAPAVSITVRDYVGSQRDRRPGI